MPLQGTDGCQGFFDLVEAQADIHPFIAQTHHIDLEAKEREHKGADHNVGYYAAGNFSCRIWYTPTVYCHSQLAVGSLS